MRCCMWVLSQTGQDVKNDQFDAAYDLSSADEGGRTKRLAPLHGSTSYFTVDFSLLFFTNDLPSRHAGGNMQSQDTSKTIFRTSSYHH